MANNETKTNAEIYREQRKARLAKAAKKKKHGRNDKLIGIIVKVISIILVAALILYLIGSMLTNIFFVPQKVLTAAKYGDYKISVAEYNYFYMSLFNQACNTADSYESYYTGMGASYFDSTVDPAEQTCQASDIPEGVSTWAEYFAHCAPERAFLVMTLYDKATSDEAVKAGFQISTEDQNLITTSIDETMAYYEEQATASDFSLNNYLSRTFGEGVTEELYRELLEKEYVADLYIEWYQENCAENISVEEADAHYNEHKEEYDVATFRAYNIAYTSDDAGETATDEETEEPTYTKEEALARAEEFKNTVTDETSFKAAAIEFAPESQKDGYESDSATLISNYTKADISGVSEEMAEWIYSADRVVNDISIFDSPDELCYYVILVTSPAGKNTTPTSADVRHILIEVPTTTESDSGEEVDLPDETIQLNKENALKEAEEIKALWEENGKTEQAFIDLVPQYTDDSGSAETGGLYEDINSTSSYVTAFKNWAIDPNREVGDVEIIETEYGYHLMYYVGGDKTETWESTIRSELSTTAANDFLTELQSEIRTGLVTKTAVCNYFSKRTKELVDSIVANNASSSSYSSYY